MNKHRFSYYGVLITVIVCMILFPGCGISSSLKALHITEETQPKIKTAYGYYEVIGTWEAEGYDQTLIRDPYSDVLYIANDNYYRLSVTALYDKNGDLLTYAAYMEDESHPLHDIAK